MITENKVIYTTEQFFINCQSDYQKTHVKPLFVKFEFLTPVNVALFVDKCKFSG